MIYDVITYNSEKELFEIRYNILKDYVDQFIVVEFDKTFSGQPKPWRFIEDFKGYKFEKVCYHGIEEKTYLKYKVLAESSPNTKGASHWLLEFMQKESIKDALAIHHLQDDDIIFIGDCDEIWDFRTCHVATDNPAKLKLRVYSYYLNNRSNEEFYGTITAQYGQIKDKCLNHLRSFEASKANTLAGWHFTSMHHQLKQKLTDSYTEESYATPQVMANLEQNIKESKDFLGRGFTYTIDESDWPQYLKDNREKYLHLLKDNI